MIAFRLKVGQLFEKERASLETKIDNALDIQNTLSELVRQQKLAAEENNQQQLDSFQGLIQDIQGHESFLGKKETEGSKN